MNSRIAVGISLYLVALACAADPVLVQPNAVVLPSDPPPAAAPVVPVPEAKAPATGKAIRKDARGAKKAKASGGHGKKVAKAKPRASKGKPRKSRS